MFRPRREHLCSRVGRNRTRNQAAQSRLKGANHNMGGELFGEFMGTLVLVLLGNGVVANVVLKKTLGSNAGWLTIVFGYGLGVVAGVFVAVACGSAGAHINPAVTLGLA